MPITSKGFVLMDDKGAPVEIGQMIMTTRGKQMRLLGGSSPQHEHSLGRIYVEDADGFKREFAPRVCKLHWVKMP